MSFQISGPSDRQVPRSLQHALWVPAEGWPHTTPTPEAGQTEGVGSTTTEMMILPGEAVNDHNRSPIIFAVEDLSVFTNSGCCWTEQESQMTYCSFSYASVSNVLIADASYVLSLIHI